MAEASSEASKICAQCGTEFVPWTPKRGPKPSRCRACYPEARTKLVMDWISGEFDPTKTCRNCGEHFQRTKAKLLLCDHCRDKHRQSAARERALIVWQAKRKPKPTCRECGGQVAGHAYRFYCSQSCQLKRNRRVNSATRRARIRRQRLELFDPVAICERDGWRCYLCGQPTPKNLRGTQLPDAPEVDHIMPLAKGGAHTADNVACACHGCNSRKSDSFEIDHAVAANRLNVRRRECVPTERPSA